MSRKASGSAVVVAMFVFIASIAFGAWFFTRTEDDRLEFARAMANGA